MVGLLADVVLPFAHLAVSIYAGVMLIQEVHVYWGLLTILTTFIPGIVEIIYWSVKLCRGKVKSKEHAWLWIAASLIFPLSYLIWHVKLWYSGLKKGDNWLKMNYYSQRCVLSCVTALTDGALQSILQVVILLHTWDDEDLEKKLVECTLIATSVSSVSLACSEHHYHLKTAKQDKPQDTEIEIGVIYYFFTNLSRTLIWAFLAIYLKGYIFIVFAAVLTANFVLSFLIIEKEELPLMKNLLTAIGSVSVPVAFVSTEDLLTNRHKIGHTLFKYHVANTVSFIGVTLITAILTWTVLIPSGVVGFDHANSNGMVGNHTVPAISCLDEQWCKNDWPVFCANLFLIAFSGLIIWMQDKLFPSFFNRYRFY